MINHDYYMLRGARTDVREALANATDQATREALRAALVPLDAEIRRQEGSA